MDDPWVHLAEHKTLSALRRYQDAARKENGGSAQVRTPSKRGREGKYDKKAIRTQVILLPIKNAHGDDQQSA